MSLTLEHFILHKLREKPLSGYALCKEIEKLSGKRPSFGSIYPLLERLTRDGKVTMRQDGRRKVYRLSHKGETHVTQHRTEACDMGHIIKEIKMICELTGQRSEPIIGFLERLGHGEIPFGAASPSVIRLRDTVLAMAHDGTLARNARKATRILDQAQRGLERLR